jgi:hypothetical protein
MKKSILSLFILINIANSGDLSRDDNGIVTDSSTSLQWQDNVKLPLKNWIDAIEYCENLSLNGNNWRLPNIYEIRSLLDYSKYGPATKEDIFINNSKKTYWSSTTLKSDTATALNIDIESGRSYSYSKSAQLETKCVRYK